MIRCNVVNCKTHKEHDVYIGRPSKWGNPFEIGKDGSRMDVIRKYREYLTNNQELMNSLKELKFKTLGCWCKPENCHGDVLVELVDKLEDEEIDEKRKNIESHIRKNEETMEFLNNVIAMKRKQKANWQDECSKIGHDFKEYTQESEVFFENYSYEKCLTCGFTRKLGANDNQQ